MHKLSGPPEAPAEAIFMTPTEVAKVLRIKVHTLYAWVRNDRIGSEQGLRHVGVRKYLFYRPDFERFLKGNDAPAEPKPTEVTPKPTIDL